ncbi:MAG: 16S rRNA (adenine(1518)-N(6)/adenine(1519)-N(6))-dimethyltransferase RsmA [bacterium]|nr:16S rRNA (adenine(1518)-N(6)/adenine(1519)-N(6))-dimethyltransferase RsmA [bacterium]
MEQSIKQLLNKYNIKPSKRLGQNFLIDESVLEKIIIAAELSEKDTILEIGPGLGILTLELAKKVKQVIAVEKDKKMCEILQELLDVGNVKNVKIINNDILKVRSSEFGVQDYKVVANLPYYIASPVIRMFLETENKPESMILMVQKEVAQRICARPPQMSILAVAVQFYAQPKIVSEVSKTSFFPQPKVDSAIIRITPRINTNKITNNRKFDTKRFFGMVKNGFAHKRKLLISNLKNGFEVRSFKFEDLFEEIGVDIKSRAENLSVENWIKLYGKIENIL